MAKKKQLVTSRKSKNLKLETIIYAVVEGEKTEKQYVEFLEKRLPGQTVKLKVFAPGSARKTLLDKAVELNNDDETTPVWILCDVDDEGPLLRSLKNQIETNPNIHFAISNPTFDLWLLLHHQDKTAFIDRKDLHPEVKKLGLVEGSNGKTIVRDRLSGGLVGATQRARSLRKRHHGNGTSFPNDNPSTEMDLFVSAVLATYNGQRKPIDPELTIEDLY